MWDENGRLGSLLARVFGWLFAAALVAGLVAVAFDPSRAQGFVSAITALATMVFLPFALVAAICIGALFATTRLVTWVRSRRKPGRS